MRPKVSIIVPIYNMESYLSRCLDSLIAQTLKEIEIIAINDGSFDSSGEILRKYAERDSRIKVIERQNSGVSSARNNGIFASTGEYIGFVDPDDWVELDMYEKMYNSAISGGVDIIMCSYTREFGTHSKIKNFNLPEKNFYNKKELDSNVLRRLVGPINEEISNPEMLDAWGTVWSKLYRSNLIKDNNLAFIDLKEIGTNEDSLFNIEACYFAKSFVFLNIPYYHYWRMNDNAVTAGYKPNLINQWFNLYAKIYDFIKNKKMDEEFNKALSNRICLSTLGLGLNTLSSDNHSSVFHKLKKIKSILNDRRIKRSFKQLDLSQFPIIWRTFYLFAKIRFAAGFYLMLTGIRVLQKIVR